MTLFVLFLQMNEKIAPREIDGMYTNIMANMNKITVDLNSKLKVCIKYIFLMDFLSKDIDNLINPPMLDWSV